VRNRRNGQVEALVRGPAAALDRLRDACHRGPPASSVTGLVERPAEPHELAETPFEQRPTA
jgi:acylphosphatase